MKKHVALRVVGTGMHKARVPPPSQHNAWRAEVGRSSLTIALLDVRHEDQKANLGARLLHAMMLQSAWTALSRGRSHPSVSHNPIHLQLPLPAAGEDAQQHLWVHLRSRRHAAQCHCL